MPPFVLDTAITAYRLRKALNGNLAFRNRISKIHIGVPLKANSNRYGGHSPNFCRLETSMFEPPKSSGHQNWFVHIAVISSAACSMKVSAHPKVRHPTVNSPILLIESLGVGIGFLGPLLPMSTIVDTIEGAVEKANLANSNLCISLCFPTDAPPPSLLG